MATTQPQQPSINLAAEASGQATVTTDGAGAIDFASQDGAFDASTLTTSGLGQFTVDFVTPRAAAPDAAQATTQAPLASGTGFASVSATTTGVLVTVRDAAGALVDLAATPTSTVLKL